MRFSDQTFFYYERNFWRGFSLDDLFRDGRKSSESLFTLSGMADFREALLIVDEWYHQYPEIAFKELRREKGENPASVDPLDNEPMIGKREYNRIIKIRAHITHDPGEFHLQKTGTSLKQNVELNLGLLQLWKTDYWPAPGDQLFYLGHLHELVQVVAPPANYWQHSGVPMHLTVRAELAHYGDGEPPLHALDLDTAFEEPAILMPAPEPKT